MGNQYSYEDHPDGTHCLHKTACVTKYTTAFGFWVGTFDVICITQPTTLAATLVRFPMYLVPGMASGMVMGMSACMFTQLRGKDDKMNYWLGGMASGATIGVCRRSFKVGVPCAMLIGLAATLYKHGRENNFTFFPTQVRAIGSWDSMAADYTMLADRPKYTGRE